MICGTNPPAMAVKKNKGGRPQIGAEPLDITTNIRLAKSDRAKIAAGAAACGMNKTSFMRQAVLNICELVTSEAEDLPAAEDIPLVNLSRYLKNNPSVKQSVKF